MMPSCDFLFLVASDSVQLISISDFLSGLNKRELDQKKIGDKIRKLQSLTTIGTDHQTPKPTQILQPRSCRQQTIETVFDWPDESTLFTEFQDLTHKVSVPRLLEVKIKRWLKSNILDKKQTVKKVVNKSTKSSNSCSDDEYASSDDSFNYLK